MSTQRNYFLESLQFNISDIYEAYEKYAFEWENNFNKQAIHEHEALMLAFPEVDFYTICRTKSFDSTFKKAQSKGLENVYDIHGVRHIIRSVGR